MRLYSTSLLALFALVPLAVAQNAGPIDSAKSGKPLAFEVVSIRPAKPGSTRMFGWWTTPDGYHVPSQSLFSTIMIAYFPQGMAYWTKQRLSGAPPWLDDLYDIDAKVSEADLGVWQRQGMALDKKPMLQQMLQTMLAERCHFAAHFVAGDPVDAFVLGLGKRNPHLTESKSDEIMPVGMKLPDGGVSVGYQRGEKPHLSYLGATMADLAYGLSILSGHPVQDHTGLTGHFDFVINWVDDPDSKLPEGVVNSNDPDPLSHWDLESFGLRVTPIKLPGDTLVIDHIEKPSEN